jgi:hypothetical protein
MEVNMIIFNRIRELLASIKFLNTELDSAGSATKEIGSYKKGEMKLRLFMQAFITIVGFLAGLYIFFSPSSTPDQLKIAWFLVGTVIGYWLK